MILAADLFCGAGGSSTGLVQAAQERGRRLDLLAVNHWSVAVDTHTRNHPWARHLCADLSQVDPSKVIPGGRLDILIASPECTHHSLARGGKPCSDQSRASAWHVLHWVERLRVERVLIENVREFEQWGPLGDDGRPDKSRKGQTFKAFIAALESLRYTVEWRVQNAADFGEATNRRRLFIQAARGGGVTWPEASHHAGGVAGAGWRPAREVIDWSLRGEEISKRKRPLAPRTMDRIEAGLRKFGGEPFIAVLRGTRKSQSGAWAKPLSDPLGTISAGGIHAALCEPFIVPMEHSGRQPVRGTDAPLPTITTARGGSFGLCQPFVMQVAHAGSDHTRVRSVDAPLPTIVAGHRGELAVCQPFLVEYHGPKRAGDQRVASVESPLPTQTTENRFGLCQPFLTKYYGNGEGARPVTEPMDTITTKDRFALVEPTRMGIYFRMLKPHELAAAMGFDGYEFAGTKTDQVRQIGNAVSVRTAKALCGAMIDAGKKPEFN
jgi:DNA (cytosine-5)-methyltransferase 1